MPTIHITKNQGLLYGLKQYIESQHKTFSLTNTNYQKVMTVFKQINKDRASDKKIYTGGETYTGKVDWHKNFVVQEGDIDLTQAEMDKLYEAMGLEITTTPDSSSDTPTGGTPGADTPTGNTPVTNDTISGETIKGDEGNNRLRGTNRDDLIYGYGGDDNISGRAGNDTIYCGSGNDTARGGKDNDLMYGEGGKDKLKGNRGNDTIHGGADNDTLKGGKDNDLIYGEEGNDILKGNSGDDTIEGGKGNDTLVGGAGKDTFVFTKDDGIDLIRDADKNDSIYIKEVSADALKFVQDGKNLVIYYDDSYDENNKIIVKDYFSKSKNNRIQTVTIDNNGNKQEINLSAVQIRDAKDITPKPKNQPQSQGGNQQATMTITGDSTTGETITGIDTGKFKVLRGTDANDLIITSKDGDIAYGGKSNDTIIGSEGSDWLFGEEGNDVLTGGADNDKFIFYFGNQGVDTITDAENGDVIEINYVDKNNLRYVKDGKNLVIYYNENKDDNNKIIVKDYFAKQEQNRIRKIILDKNEEIDLSKVTIEQKNNDGEYSVYRQEITSAEDVPDLTTQYNALKDHYEGYDVSFILQDDEIIVIDNITKECVFKANTSTTSSEIKLIPVDNVSRKSS